MTFAFDFKLACEPGRDTVEIDAKTLSEAVNLFLKPDALAAR